MWFAHTDPEIKKWQEEYNVKQTEMLHFIQSTDYNTLQDNLTQPY